MNTYLLGLITKWASIAFSAVLGIFGFQDVTTIQNTNQTKNSATQINEVAYEVVTEYNDKLPKDVVVTKQEGKNGIIYTNLQNGNILTLETPTDEIIEVGTGEEGKFVGKMTGYGADCLGCSQEGLVSCKTYDGRSWSLTQDGTTYVDHEYGSVRILAASLSKFPCGTIIKVENDTYGNFNAIVLDTGGAMRNAWSHGEVHMDLAFVSEHSDGVYDATNKNVKYSVQRWGW